MTFSPGDFIDAYNQKPGSTEASAFFSKYVRSMELRDNLGKARLETPGVQLNDADYYETFSPLTFDTPFKRICPGQIVIGSGDGYSFLNNLEEYRSRYRNPRGPELDHQLQCFDDLLAYLAQRHIKVFAVDMPLTDVNRKLLPDSFWTYYHTRIYEICQKRGATCVDLCTAPFSPKIDFCDTAHLNLHGGTGLAKYLALRIAEKL